MNVSEVPLITNNHLANLVGLLLKRAGGTITFSAKEMRDFCSTKMFYIGRTEDPVADTVTFYLEDLGHVKH